MRNLLFSVLLFIIIVDKPAFSQDEIHVDSVRVSHILTFEEEEQLSFFDSAFHMQEQLVAVDFLIKDEIPDTVEVIFSDAPAGSRISSVKAIQYKDQGRDVIFYKGRSVGIKNGRYQILLKVPRKYLERKTYLTIWVSSLGEKIKAFDNEVRIIQ